MYMKHASVCEKAWKSDKQGAQSASACTHTCRERERERTLTMWSPALAKESREVVMAAQPEANSRVPLAPSSLAITSAAASTVGLPHLVYR